MVVISKIDVILFNGEQIIEIRIPYLYNSVDYFLIVESRETHSGKIKDILYYESNYFKNFFNKYIDKIKFIIIDKFPEITNEWKNSRIDNYMNSSSYESWFKENYQRNYAIEFLKEYEPYVATICDVDEIPDKFIYSISYNNCNNPIALEMKFYYYSFRWIKKELWTSAFIINDIGIKKYKDLSYCRTLKNKMGMVKNAGWHCSYFLSPEDIIRKLESFAHRECDQIEFKKKEHVLNSINNGIDLFNRGPNENLLENTEIPEPFLL
jgi:beta-1,4-mannosyl-glycoprotein beta-1,4-N-acetylglucosaminyltransferase